jgi:putative PIN family toxin of toxin-antitoxin system
MLRVVIDTNVWICILLRGRTTLPLLAAFNENRFQLIMSQPLMEEFHAVWNRPRFQQRIDHGQARRLEYQLMKRSILVDVTTIPPNCRDTKDLPILATAIDGKADCIVSADNDLRADAILRREMQTYGIQLFGVNSFLAIL